MECKYDIEKILGEINRRKISISQYAKENGLVYNNLISALRYARTKKQIDKLKSNEQLLITEIPDDAACAKDYNFSLLFEDNKKIMIQTSSVKDIEAILMAAKNV